MILTPTRAPLFTNKSNPQLVKLTMQVRAERLRISIANCVGEDIRFS